jgi:hypothetical protein
LPLDRDLSASKYHAIKALSAGMIWTMDSECPLKAWLDSPWNESLEAESATHFDIGTAAHLAILEPDKFAERTVCHEFPTYQSNAAKVIRYEARAAGKVPLKPEETELVLAIRDAVKRDLMTRDMFRKGDAEISLTWEWGGLACKCRPDFLAEDFSYVLDLKTANTVNPGAIGRKAQIEGWFVRAAWYLAGIKEVTGVMPKEYRFVTIEKGKTPLVMVYQHDIGDLFKGEQIIRRSLNRAKECFAVNKWPSYGDGIMTIKLPTWAAFQHAEREENGDFDD